MPLMSQIRRLPETAARELNPLLTMWMFSLSRTLDGSGNVTAASGSVRQIRITITGRTAKPDPAYAANGGYRTYALTSIVALRN